MAVWLGAATKWVRTVFSILSAYYSVVTDQLFEGTLVND